MENLNENVGFDKLSQRDRLSQRALFDGRVGFDRLNQRDTLMPELAEGRGATEGGTTRNLEKVKIDE
jgi:hypothetical protein